MCCTIGGVPPALRSGARTPPAFAADAAAGLKSMTGDVKPIGRAEYLARIDKARALMGKLGIGALLIEPGASLVYFTGVHWWRSERLTAAVLPREGEIAIVTPHFEEPSVRESLQVPAEVRVWNEDEDPLRHGRRHPARPQSRRARWPSKRPCASSRSTACGARCRAWRSATARPWCAAAAW